MLYRDAAFIGVIKPGLLAIFTVISFSTFFLGGFVFSRLKPLFADYV
jgi:lipopolysaccharide transport system permease protein